MNHHQVEPKRYFQLVEVESLAEKIVKEAIEKYDIKSLEDFKCDNYRQLAIKLKLMK